MPLVNLGSSEYKQYSISNFTGGMNATPNKPNQHFMIYNMFSRPGDGRLVPRGTVTELQCPTAIQTTSSTPIDNLVNNTGGPVVSAETPYLFWVQNHPGAGQLELWKVVHSGTSQTMSAVGNTSNTAVVNPTLPAYCWAADNNGKPFFIFSNWNGTGADVQYQWDGTTLSNVSSTPPASQSMLLFTYQTLLAGGGSINGAYSIRNVLFYSSPSSLTSWPSTNFTVPFVEKGLGLMDAVVTNSRPILVTNISILSLNGSNPFTAVEIGSVQDILLKNTISASGTIPVVAGQNGVYFIGDKLVDISEPLKGIYFPITFSYGTGNSGFKAGYGTFSTNGYFYGIYNQNPPASSLITNMLIPHTTNEKSVVLVYDTNFKCWYYWGYEFTIAGMAPLDANALNITTSANTFITGFAFSGSSPTGKNALYFNNISGSGGSDTVDTANVNYNVGFVSGPLDFGLPASLKTIGGFTVVGTTSGTAELKIQGCNTNKVYDIIKVRDNEFLECDIKVEEPIRLIFSDNSKLREIAEFNVYYKVREMAVV